MDTDLHQGDEVRPALPPGTERRRNEDQQLVLVGPSGSGYMGLSEGEEGLVDLLDGAHTLDALVTAGLSASPQVRPMAVLAMLRRLDRAGLLLGMEGELERLFGESHRGGSGAVMWLARIGDIRLMEDPPGLVTLPTALGRWIPRGTWPIFHGLAFVGLVSVLLWAASGQRLAGLIQVFPRGPSTLELLTALYGLAALVLSVRGLLRGWLMRSMGMLVPRAGLRIRWGIVHLDIDDRERRAASGSQRMHLALVGLSSLAATATLCAAIALNGGHGLSWLATGVALLALLVNLAPYLRTDGRQVMGIWTRVPGMRRRSLAYLQRKALAPWRKSDSTRQDWAYSVAVSLWLAHGAITIYVLGDRIVPGSLRVIGDLVGGRAALSESSPLLLPVVAVVLGLLILSLLGLVGGLALLVLSFGKHVLFGWMKTGDGKKIDAGHEAQAAFVEAAPGIPFLSGLGEEGLSALAGKLMHETYSAGQLVIRQGDPGDRFCFIQKGGCVVEIEETSGLIHEAAHLGAGDFFGEVALLEEVSRTATVRAEADVEVLSLEREAFLQLLKELGVSPDVVLTQIRNAAFVRHHRFFHTVPASKLGGLLTRIEEHRLNKDDVVVRQGEGGRSLYIIREGSCVVDHTAEGGDVLEVARLEPGDHFGEIALLGDGVRTATVRAAEAAVVLEVPHDLFQDVLLKNFEAVVQLDQGCADRLNLLQAH